MNPRIRRARVLRMAKGITLNEAAAAIGVDPAALSRYERCYHSLSVERLIAYAKLLGCGIEELHGELEDDPPQARRARLSPRRRASIAGAAAWRKSRSRKLSDAAKGGNGTLARYGKEHYKRMAHKRWAGEEESCRTLERERRKSS